MERPTCETCPHWISLPDNQAGNCTKHAPQPLPIGINKWNGDGSDFEWGYFSKTTSWPMTMRNEGCGEHPDFLEWAKAWFRPFIPLPPYKP